MVRKAKQLAPLLLSALLIWPLLGSESCDGATQEADQAEPTAAAPALPNDPAQADQLLKSGGPEVLSPPVDSDQDAYQGDAFDGDAYENSDAEGDTSENQERVGDTYEHKEDVGDTYEHQEDVGDTYEHQEDEGDVTEWQDRNAAPQPGVPQDQPAPDAD